MEMSEGESFALYFEILNPRQTDIGLLETWREDINDGFLRFGALSSQGRGRVEITAESYTLYLRENMKLAERLQNLPEDDLFYQIWKGKLMTLNELRSFALS